MALLSSLLVLLLVAPLALGIAFILRFWRQLKKPGLAGFAVIAEGYALAGVVFSLFGGYALFDLGLSGVPSTNGASGRSLETSLTLALVTFVALYVVLLWWNLRVLPKRG